MLAVFAVGYRNIGIEKDSDMTIAGTTAEVGHASIWIVLYNYAHPSLLLYCICFISLAR